MYLRKEYHHYDYFGESVIVLNHLYCRASFLRIVLPVTRQEYVKDVDVQTGWLSQFPPVLQQISVSNSFLVQSLIPFSLQTFSASEWVEVPGHLPMVLQVFPSSEQQRTPAPKGSGWNVPR